MSIGALGDSKKKSIRRKIVLIPLGLAVGLFIGWLGILAWDAVKPGPRAISKSDHPALRAMLDGDNSPRGLYLFDEEIGYRFKPNFSGIRHKTDDAPHVTNSLGLLGEREVGDSNIPRKILILGDSVTYGDGVPYESTFVSQMQSLAGADYQLANGACPGWNAKQQIGFYENRLSNVGWDAVIFAVCLNDFVDFQWGWTEGRGYEWIMSDSSSTFAAFRISRLRKRFPSGTSEAPLARHDDATISAWHPSTIDSFCKKVLLPFTRRTKHTRIILIVLPTAHQFDALAAGADNDVVHIPQRKLTAFCRKHEVFCIDALALLREKNHVESKKLFLPDDALHFRATGHQALAEALWPRVEALLNQKPAGH